MTVGLDFRTNAAAAGIPVHRANGIAVHAATVDDARQATHQVGRQSGTPGIVVRAGAVVIRSASANLVASTTVVPKIHRADLTSSPRPLLLSLGVQQSQVAPVRYV